jgi:hypothetical protein
MSISPAQLTLVLGASDRAAATEQSAGVPSGGAPKSEAPVAEAAAHAEPSGPKLTTALRIDDQRRIYYEVINNQSGEVVYQIPPEQVRKLGEGISESLRSRLMGRSIDVKS